MQINESSRRRAIYWGALAAATIAATAESRAWATIIDDFSTDSSASYNLVDVFGAGGAYSRTGETFTPAASTSVATSYFRNTGEKFSAAGGDTVSLDLLAIKQTGIAFTLDPLSDVRTELTIEHDQSPGAWWPTFVDSFTAPTDPETDPIGLTAGIPATLSVTRDTVDSTKFFFTLTGGGLADPVDGSFTKAAFLNQDVYFGIFAYKSGNVVDNLSFTPAPEPSSSSLLMIGFAYCVAKRRRRPGDAV